MLRISLYFTEIGWLKIKHLMIVTYENTKRTLAKKNYGKVILELKLFVVDQILNGQLSSILLLKNMMFLEQLFPIGWKNTVL